MAAENEKKKKRPRSPRAGDEAALPPAKRAEGLGPAEEEQAPVGADGVNNVLHEFRTPLRALCNAAVMDRYYNGCYSNCTTRTKSVLKKHKKEFERLVTELRWWRGKGTHENTLRAALDTWLGNDKDNFVWAQSVFRCIAEWFCRDFYFRELAGHGQVKPLGARGLELVEIAIAVHVEEYRKMWSSEVGYLIADMVSQDPTITDDDFRKKLRPRVYDIPQHIDE